MLHPALTQALAAAHIEDLHRAAARRYAIRLARRVVHEPRVAVSPIAAPRSASTRVHGRRAQADDTNRDCSSSPTAVPIGRRRPLGAAAGIDPASSSERPASSLTRTSCGSE